MIARWVPSLVVLAAVALLALVSSDSPAPQPLANSVLAEPRVDCGVESISAWIRTEKPFRGRLYVEDESEQPQCVHSYAQQEGNGGERPPRDNMDSRGAEFTIRFGQCNMRRQRVLNPRGVTYSFTLVISFHPFFLTGIDRAFNIKCFFMEAVRAVDTSVDVNALSTSVVQREFELPQCTYHLRHGLDGPFLKYASIGEPVTHVWQCDPVAGWLYGVLVHSCFVDDGHGNRFDLVDDRGCVTDRSLLASIHYDEKAFTAYAHTHVFRYADRVQLFFTCTVQLCFREDGGCEGISPPQCDGASKIKDHRTFSAPRPHATPSPPPTYQRPPGLNRNFRKQPDSRKPTSKQQALPPPPQHLFGNVPPPFGGGPLPFKDSPLGNGTGGGGEDDRMIDEVLFSAIASGNNRSRAGREVGELLDRMETDLGADLTVVPRAKEGGSGEGKEERQRMSAIGEGQNPFVRVLPIKRDEYSPLTSHLDSQRIGSFEMLAIAAVSLGATVTVTSVITTICLQRCRMNRMIGEKLGAVGTMLSRD